jgi:YceI-like protein
VTRNSGVAVRPAPAWCCPAAVALLLLVAWPTSGAQPRPVSLVVAPGASLELDGDSTLHRYSAKAHGMEAGIGVDTARLSIAVHPPDLEGLVRGHFIKTFFLSVPVDQLSSGEKGLDANMRKALKGDRYKRIRFEMDSYEVLGLPAVAATNAAGLAGPLSVTLHGRLSLAGVERRIDVAATGVPVPEGLEIRGSKNLLMTDYLIKPPTVMLGAIKTKDLITVKFAATLEKGGSQ